ncbi:MAG: prepilin-type N-terminal cleavage/methylation domain-containing protein [Cellulomonas sp.]|nr:prepilin-type N-terminal cleavage/methylation domain-containing protein [Cellulomonas sp.]
MIARVRKSMDEKDQGFTLIELLVVIIIIGILAAIAIPVFLNQRKKAVDAGIKSDLRTVAVQMETYFTDNQAYIAPSQAGGAGTAVTVTGTTIPVTKGNLITGELLSDATTVVAVGGVATGFCLTGTNAAGTSTQLSIYNSLTGGLNVSTTAKCP